MNFYTQSKRKRKSNSIWICRRYENFTVRNKKKFVKNVQALLRAFRGVKAIPSSSSIISLKCFEIASFFLYAV